MAYASFEPSPYDEAPPAAFAHSNGAVISRLQHPAGRHAATEVARTDQVATAAPRRKVDLLAIAQGFAASAADIDELHGCTERHWVLLAATDLFEAWAIGWPVGGGIELHDHGSSSGALVVAQGSLLETRVRPTEHGVAVLSSQRLDPGQHRTFGPHYVHDIINDGAEDAISVHVYGPKLSTMTYYQLEESGRLNALRSEVVEPIGPFDVSRDHDPS